MLQQDELLQQQYDLLARIWKEKHDDIKDEDNINASTIISRIMNRAANESSDADIVTRRKKRRSRLKAYFAFTFFVIAVTTIILINSNNDSPPSTAQTQQEVIVTQKGSRSRTLLADGTTVWLNGESKLHYENDFTGATREVTLEGEAFFDVVKQKDRPFIVHTSGIDIKVLGTAFNVKSYPEDKNVETTLYGGLVQVLRHGDAAGKAIQLIPNHKLILPKQAAIETTKLSEDKRLSLNEPASLFITPIDSTKKESERIETAWRYNRLEFVGDNFEEVAKKLERWYNVTIVFTDEKVKQLYGLTGSFETETVAEAFAALKELYPINYKITNHEIFVESSQ